MFGLLSARGKILWNRSIVWHRFVDHMKYNEISFLTVYDQFVSHTQWFFVTALHDTFFNVPELKFLIDQFNWLNIYKFSFTYTWRIKQTDDFGKTIIQKQICVDVCGIIHEKMRPFSYGLIFYMYSWIPCVNHWFEIWVILSKTSQNHLEICALFYFQG